MQVMLIKRVSVRAHLGVARVWNLQPVDPGGIRAERHQGFCLRSMAGELMLHPENANPGEVR